MYRSLSSQLFGFTVFFAVGVLLGAVYDILRIWRAMFRSEKRSIFFQDFFYMVLAAFFAFLINLAVNGGELRFYLLLGGIFGFAVWHETVGRVTVSLFRRLFRFLYRKLFDPASAFLHRIFSKAGLKMHKIFGKCGKKLQSWKKCLKHHCAVVYNQHKRKTKRGLQTRKDARGYEGSKGQKTKKKPFTPFSHFRLRGLRLRSAHSAAGHYRQ